jgi:hypothetical protein
LPHNTLLVTQHPPAPTGAGFRDQLCHGADQKSQLHKRVGRNVQEP